jgi:hypothetical protein
MTLPKLFKCSGIYIKIRSNFTHKKLFSDDIHCQCHLLSLSPLFWRTLQNYRKVTFCSVFSVIDWCDSRIGHITSATRDNNDFPLCSSPSLMHHNYCHKNYHFLHKHFGRTQKLKRKSSEKFLFSPYIERTNNLAFFIK